MTADKSGFTNLLRKWEKSKILMFTILIFLGLLFNYGSKYKSSVATIVLFWILCGVIFTRMYAKNIINDLSRFNQIISSIQINGEVIVETFPVSTQFGLVRRPVIALTFPKLGYIVA